jgi:HPt (histidine-containing phosphotransfer) domain-containing protein
MTDPAGSASANSTSRASESVSPDNEHEGEAANVDHSALDGVTGDDDAAFKRELVTAYIENAVVTLRDLREAVDNRRVDLVVEKAHKLKGSSATVGATRMAALCRALEEQAHDGALAEAEDTVREMEEEWSHTKTALSAYLE